MKAIGANRVDVLNPIDGAGEHLKKSYHPGSLLLRLKK